MTQGGRASHSGDPFNLDRFVNAQEGVYDRAFAELCDGLKRSHWMWYIFPQIGRLGPQPHDATVFH